MSSNKPIRRWQDKQIIGLTGNIATGKSAIMRMAEEQKALTLDADKIVHQIMDTDPSMQAAIAVAFGSHVRKPDGRIDRAVLASIVFKDAKALHDLEQMLHPAVRTEIIQRINNHPAKVVMIEAIKLLEGGLAQECDQIWVTTCSRVRQIERLIICRGMDEETATLRVNVQPPQEEKIAKSDVVIDTNGTIADSRLAFERAWARLGEIATLKKPELPSKKVEASPSSTEIRREKPILKLPASVDSEVTVRRARPSDVPAVLLLMTKATQGSIKLKRGELLLAMSERSYLIGQKGTEISTVVGWAADSSVARIEQIYIHPLTELPITTYPVLQEIETTADQLLCECLLAFLSTNTPAEVWQLFEAMGYQERVLERLPRVWKRAAEESQPPHTTLLVKVLRDIRIA